MLYVYHPSTTRTQSCTSRLAFDMGVVWPSKVVANQQSKALTQATVDSKAQDHCSSAFTVAGHPRQGAEGASDTRTTSTSVSDYAPTSAYIVTTKVCFEACLGDVLASGLCTALPVCTPQLAIKLHTPRQACGWH